MSFTLNTPLIGPELRLKIARHYNFAKTLSPIKAQSERKPRNCELWDTIRANAGGLRFD